MIIKTSNMHMSAEHQKSEYTAMSRTLDTDALINGFSAQMLEVQARNEHTRLQLASRSFGGITTDTSQPGSFLLMADAGSGFRVTDNADKYDRQEDEVRARLWQSLLNAIQSERAPGFSVDETLYPFAVAPGDAASKDSASGNVGGEYSTGQTVEPSVELRPMSLQMRFRVSETIEEYECSSFSSCGKVTTADGQSIEFDLNMTMERSYSAVRDYEVIQEVAFTDPLVLNFDGNYADLSDEKYEFDLDADGDKELISYLSGNSGMLALDKNSDGIINDGSELFGALTGNGFAELARYDEDANGFIDEADAIYDELLIWNKGPESESLTSLKEHDVGAIYLGSTDTPFDIKGEDNQHNGRVRASGVYLTDAGDVGTLQQIDMVV